MMASLIVVVTLLVLGLIVEHAAPIPKNDLTARRILEMIPGYFLASLPSQLGSTRTYLWNLSWSIMPSQSIVEFTELPTLSLVCREVAADQITENTVSVVAVLVFPQTIHEQIVSMAKSINDLPNEMASSRYVVLGSVGINDGETVALVFGKQHRLVGGLEEWSIL